MHPRPIASIKERKLSLQKKNSNSVELQLQQAHLEIAHLKQENQLLSNRVAQLEHQQKVVEFLNEEIAFRKGEQETMKVLLGNADGVNMKLREKVSKLEMELESLSAKELATTVGGTARVNESFELQCPTTRTFRGSQARHSHRRSDSCESHHQRQNHPITPKSRVNIDIGHFFEDKPGGVKKKVFL